MPRLRPENVVRACFVAICWVLLPAAVAAAQPSVDAARLPEALRAQGFTPPDGFKALVVRVGRSGDSFRYDWFDWEGTSLDRDIERFYQVDVTDRVLSEDLKCVLPRFEFRGSPFVARGETG